MANLSGGEIALIVGGVVLLLIILGYMYFKQNSHTSGFLLWPEYPIWDENPLWRSFHPANCTILLEQGGIGRVTDYELDGNDSDQTVVY